MNPARLALIGALGAMIGSISGGAHLMGVSLSMALGAAMMLYARRR